ncbi:MAG: TrmH family RNA methyltransferase [Candidatus Limnocylindrales bacterium]
MTRIDSPSNPRVKAAVALRDRAARIESGLTIVDGARESLRALEQGVMVTSAFVCRDLVRSDDARRLMELLRDRPELIDVSERAHDRVAYGNRGDGVVLVVRPVLRTLDDLDPGPAPLILVTEDVEKPGNLGAILRTADAAGCSAVIAVGGTDLFNPNVIRASVGAVFSVPVAAATADEAMAWLQTHAIRRLAARVEGSIPYTAADMTGGVALIFGSEASGLSPAWAERDVQGVAIRMDGVADSLNVAATAAILAFEARRQRDQLKTTTKPRTMEPPDA